MCGKVLYRGEILFDEEGQPARGKWEPTLTDEEYDEIVALWSRKDRPAASRLGAVGRGKRTVHLLSPFLRCGKCNARMLGTRQRMHGKLLEFYLCAGKANGGCGGIRRAADPINEYIKALVIAEQQTIQFRKLEELPPWPKTQELTDLQARIADSTRHYEEGTYSAERYWPSLARMEARESELKNELRKYERRQQTRKHAVTNLAEEWDKPSFTVEQKQAVIAQTLSAIVVKPAGRGVRFKPDQIVPVFREDDTML
jgi:hypothetical protein